VCTELKPNRQLTSIPGLQQNHLQVEFIGATYWR